MFSDKMSFKIALNNIINKTRKEGIIEGLSYSNSLVVEKFYKTHFHSVSRPSLDELYSVAYVQTNNIDKLFLALKINNFLKEKENEFNKVFLDYKERLKRIKLVYPEGFSINYDEAKILYMLTLYTKPQIFLETGVADGTSSFFILSALEKNSFWKAY